MAASLAVLTADAILLLNAGTPGAYSLISPVVTDPRWSLSQIVDAILMADAAVSQATFRNRNNSRAALYYTTQAGIAHGVEIVAAAGPIVSVKFVVTGGSSPGRRPATEADEQEIQAEIRSALPLDYDPHYSFAGKTLYHNGAAIAARSGGGSVSVDAVYPSFTPTSACQAAAEYQWTVLCGAMTQLVPVEGENAGPAGGWGELFKIGLQDVANGEGNVSKQVENYVRQRMAQAA